MSHFAKVCDGKVLRVIVAEKEFFDTFVDSEPGEWIQTSYNTRGGKHYDADGNEDDGVALRGNYAGIGYIYDRINDVFYAPKPFESWVLNKSTWLWEAPIEMPNDGNSYLWNEEIKNWELDIKQ